MTIIEWRPPAPIWTSGSVRSTAVRQPALVECTSDSFLADFLDLMEGRVPNQTPKALAGQILPQITRPHKLFLPAHGRYYLVTGSLVCRQLSLPDRAVARAAGEKTSFVVRRLVTNGAGQVQTNADGAPIEQAWINDGPNKGWQTLAERGKLLDGEQRLPLHHVDACAAYKSGESVFADAFGLSRCGCRTVYYGYIPVGNRGKYAERYQPATPIIDPTAQFQAFVESVQQEPGGEPGHDPRKDDVEERIIKPWRGLYVNPITEKGKPDPIDAATRKVFSLYLLLDMLDVIQANLPTVYEALGSDDPNPVAGTKRSELFQALQGISHTKIGSDADLTKVLNELKPYLQLVQNKPDVAPVDDTVYDGLSSRYDLIESEQKVPQLQTLHAKFSDALDEEKNERIAQGRSWVPTPSEERLNLLHDQVVPTPAGDDIYVLRLAYEHAPCCPVVSDPSPQIIFAKFYDPDAPARHIRIELPSIKPRDLRKYKRGVGLEMSPDLRKLMNRVHKGLLDGEDLAGGSDFSLGMICSFSLQIIFLVAFIVMFIFLIALNFIFWWLAFLKICFPIPKKG